MNLHESFKNGKLPKNLNGFYKGTLEALFPRTITERIGTIAFKIWLPWYGKEFDSKERTGANHVPLIVEPLVKLRFGDSSILGKTDRALRILPFKTKAMKGLKDDVKVLRLDYDLPQNPHQVRNIVDELVETGRDEYLGKAYSRHGNDLRLVAFFRLRARPQIS